MGYFGRRPFPAPLSFDDVSDGGSIVIDNAGTIGSVSDTDALTIASDGDVTASQDLVVTGNLDVSNITVNDDGTIGSASASSAITIDSSGNVGIGASSPSSKTEIVTQNTNADGLSITADGTSFGYASNLFFKSKLAIGGSIVTAGKIVTQASSTNNSFMSFSTVGSSTLNERMRIDSSGNVGIGTSSPSAKLYVDASNLGSVFRNQHGKSFSTFDTTPDGANAWNKRENLSFAAYAGNNLLSVLIGSTTNDRKAGIQVGHADPTFATSLGRFYLNPYGGDVIVGTADNGAYRLQCNDTGVWGQGAYVNGSDERMKQNIADLSDGLNVVNQLRPVTYQYREEFSKDQSTQPGFIAQDLQQVLEDKDYRDGVVPAGPEYLNVAYQNLIPILTKAIQELSARVEQLEGK